MLWYFIICQEYLMQNSGVGKTWELRESFQKRTHKIKIAVEILFEKAGACWTQEIWKYCIPSSCFQCRVSAHWSKFSREPQAGQGLEKLSYQQYLKQLGLSSLEESFRGIWKQPFSICMWWSRRQKEILQRKLTLLETKPALWTACRFPFLSCWKMEKSSSDKYSRE